MQVTILVAILYLVLGALRLGFLCNMLSKPIISAFLTSGAIIISTSQVMPCTSRPDRSWRWKLKVLMRLNKKAPHPLRLS